MQDWKHDLSLRLVKILDIVLITLPFIACWFGYYADKTVVALSAMDRWLIVALYCVLYFTFGRIYDAFLISYSRISEIVYSQILETLLTDCFMYIVIWIMSGSFPNILPALGALLMQLVFAVGWAVMAHRWYFAMFPSKRSAVIYDVREGMENLISDYGLDKKYDVVKTVSIDDCIANIDMIDDMDIVFLSGIHSHERNVLIKYCVERGITAMIVPRIGDVIMSSAKNVHLFHLPMLRLDRYNPSPEYLFIKRTIDILVSGIAAVLLSPVMLVVAIAIKKTDGGPVFYKQKRLTKDGKIYDVLKFRSMRVDAEKDGVARLSTGENDDRITPIGRFIRKVRLDELPQVFNILAGSMSLVGPRPERPEIAAQYEAEMPEFRLRLQAKAGLTGYAQVYGKYNTTPYDKLQMDLMYIAHPSIWEDIRIMFSTVKILFMKDSTEGVAEGQTTAASAGNEEKSA